MNKYFIIIGLQICVLIWIKIYGSGLTNNNDKECNDPLNKTLFKLRFSIWNMSHIIIFFIYCLIMKPVSFQDHFEIFMFGVVWYLMQYIINYNTDKYKNSKEQFTLAKFNELDKSINYFNILLIFIKI